MLLVLIAVGWIIVMVVSWKWGLAIIPFLLMHGLNEHRNPKGFIYYLLDEESRRIKIGRTKHNPLVRLAKLQGQSPTPLKLVTCYATPNAVAEETRLHARYANCRRHGEWFDAECMGVIDKGTLDRPRLRMVK